MKVRVVPRTPASFRQKGEQNKRGNEYNKKPFPHLHNARVGGDSYFYGFPKASILNLYFSMLNLNLSRLKQRFGILISVLSYIDRMQ